MSKCIRCGHTDGSHVGGFCWCGCDDFFTDDPPLGFDGIIGAEDPPPDFEPKYPKSQPKPLEDRIMPRLTLHGTQTGRLTTRVVVIRNDEGEFTEEATQLWQNKSPGIKNFLRNLWPDGEANYSNGICTRCHEPVGEFKDKLSVDEYGINGLCQTCQDYLFQPPTEEDDPSCNTME